MSRRLMGVGLALVVVVAAGLAAPVARAPQSAQTPSGAAAPVLIFETVKGTFEIEMFPNEAPKSVAHIVALVRKHFYRGQRVHWVQPGVVQFGDPKSRDMTREDVWGSGGSGPRGDWRPLGVAEPSKRSFVRGSVGLAYPSNQPPSGGDSQVFILRYPNPALNGKYAHIGRVTRGLDVVDKLEKFDMIKDCHVKGEQKR